MIAHRKHRLFYAVFALGIAAATSVILFMAIEILSQIFR